MLNGWLGSRSVGEMLLNTTPTNFKTNTTWIVYYDNWNHALFGNVTGAMI